VLARETSEREKEAERATPRHTQSGGGRSEGRRRRRREERALARSFARCFARRLLLLAARSLLPAGDPRGANKAARAPLAAPPVAAHVTRGLRPPRTVLQPKAAPASRIPPGLSRPRMGEGGEGQGAPPVRLADAR
jgi:hypothetical protein